MGSSRDKKTNMQVLEENMRRMFGFWAACSGIDM